MRLLDMTMDKVNRLGDTNIDDEANAENNTSETVVGKPINSPASKNWSYPSLSPANTSLYQSWSQRDIPCSTGPVTDADRSDIDDYDASIELSNNCRKFYFSHMKTAAEVRKSVSRAKKNKGNAGNTKRSSIDMAMDRLRREMAELMDQDLSLMEQLLTLNDRIEEVKYNYMYSVSKDSLYASSCDLSTSCDFVKSRDIRSGDESDSEVSVFDIELDEDYADMNLNDTVDDREHASIRKEDTHACMSNEYGGTKLDTAKSSDTISITSDLQTGMRLYESLNKLDGNKDKIRVVNADTLVINTHATKSPCSSRVGGVDGECQGCPDIQAKSEYDNTSDGNDSIKYDSGSESVDQNDDTLTDNENDGDDEVIDDDDIPFLMSTGESTSSGFVSGVESDDVFDI